MATDADSARVVVDDSRRWAGLVAEPFLDRLTERLHLHERQRDGELNYAMHHPITGERTGAVQIFDGDGLQAAVLSTAHTDSLQMWQLVAFTPPDSLLPHLSFDAKANPGGCWVSIDLIPRVPCTEEHAYVEHIYEPLSDVVWQIHSREDMQQSLIRSRHRMSLSPWLISMRLDDVTAVNAAIEAVTCYTDHFCDLVGAGIPDRCAPSWSLEQLAERDQRERALMYSWEATDNYRFLAMVGGDEAVDVVQQTLRHPNR